MTEMPRPSNGKRKTAARRGAARRHRVRPPADRIHDSVLDLIGNTPLVRLNRIGEAGSGELLGKLESCNPVGSVKDRIALSMIEVAEEQGLLGPGGTIVEPTSGNTGIGLAMVAAVKGYRLVLVMPDDMTLERRFLLRSLGAELLLTPAAEGMAGAVSEAQGFVRRTRGSFMPQQFENPANPEIHRQTTAREILAATSGRLEAFVAGIGTGGTLTGVGEVLKQELPGVLIFGVEPEASPVLTEGRAGRHMIQGIGANFVPAVLNRSVIDKVLTVADRDAFAMAGRLAREEGLLVGVSAGAATFAALQVARELGPGKRTVVVLPDTGERYATLEPYFDLDVQARPLRQAQGRPLVRLRESPTLHRDGDGARASARA